MGFKKWLMELYGTGPSGPVPSQVKPTGAVSWNNFNDDSGDMGRSRFQSTDGKVKRKSRPKSLDGFA